LIKKYTLRISSGFTLNCKEEESTPKVIITYMILREKMRKAKGKRSNF